MPIFFWECKFKGSLMIKFRLVKIWINYCQQCRSWNTKKKGDVTLKREQKNQTVISKKIHSLLQWVQSDKIKSTTELFVKP